jgi:dual specificity protein kinase YAK1
MDQQQWGNFSESTLSSNRQSRYIPQQTLPSQQPVSRDISAPPVANPSQYPPGAAPIRTSTMPVVPLQSALLRGGDLELGDRDGDVAMEDADPYKPKHARPPTHQRIGSNVQQEESSAARRYSPMNLSPSSPYGATPQQQMHSGFGNYTPQGSSRTSPTRSNSFMSPNSNAYYSTPPSKLQPFLQGLEIYI